MSHACARVLVAGIALGLVTTGIAPPAVAQGQQLEACSRGNIPVCRSILARPRLDPGRRAAIEFLLSEIERQVLACADGDETACAALTRDHPALPDDLRKPQAPAVPGTTK